MIFKLKACLYNRVVSLNVIHSPAILQRNINSIIHTKIFEMKENYSLSGRTSLVTSTTWKFTLKKKNFFEAVEQDSSFKSPVTWASIPLRRGCKQPSSHPQQTSIAGSISKISFQLYTYIHSFSNSFLSLFRVLNTVPCAIQ